MKKCIPILTAAFAIVIVLSLGSPPPFLRGGDEPPPPPAKARGAAFMPRAAQRHGGLFREAARSGDFERFLGGELRFKDADEKAVTVAGVPGKVAKLAENSLTLKPNDGSAEKDFAFKPEAEDARDLEAQLRRIEIGEWAIVVTVNGEGKWVIPVEGAKQRMEKKADSKKADSKKADSKKARAEKVREKKGAKGEKEAEEK